jgi:hypothetical protein
MVRVGLRLGTIDDLVVEHRETKTYRQGVAWMWRSGVDATALLFEFRVVRLPDLAWITWSAGVLTVIVVAATGAASAVEAGATLVALTVFISCLFVASRFLLRPRPMRFLIALVLSPPMILGYLLGRCAGLLRLRSLFRHSRDSPKTV